MECNKIYLPKPKTQWKWDNSQISFHYQRTCIIKLKGIFEKKNFQSSWNIYQIMIKMTLKLIKVFKIKLNFKFN
ncbi:unnamed protein product [Paramecium sonneborni]|uniref:Uncharacterized protein n=1 Tax=Paramecium sonneborni TaxID=65129 RepID=A0A8S1LAS1_9CILI|nr:unnamed protein product [Paramecium sonneborni]